VLNIPALPDRYHALIQRARASFQARRWQWIASVALFLLVNGYIVYRLLREWESIAAMQWSLSQPGDLALAALSHFIGVVTVIAAWGAILRRYGYAIPFRRHFKVYTLANLARKLPGGLGVDLLSRLSMYGHDGGGRLQISFATLIEPIIFGVAAAIVLLVTMLLPGGAGALVSPVIPLVILGVFLALLPSPLFRMLLARVGKAQPDDQQLRWPHILRWVITNTVTITLGGVTLFFFCRALGVVGGSSFLLLIQFWALVVVSGTLVAWLPFDTGAMTGVTILALATIMPMPQAIALLVVWRVWLTLIDMLWGGIGFLL
jgi:uncharacterized membrane protein YbhN (UPF0104 family)